MYHQQKDGSKSRRLGCVVMYSLGRLAYAFMDTQVTSVLGPKRVSPDSKRHQSQVRERLL